MPGALPILPPLSDQAGRLIGLGAHEIGSLSAAGLRAAAMGTEWKNALLVLHPDRAPASALASLLEHGGKPGFVVADMADVDQFSPIESAVLPAGPLYLVADPDQQEQGLATVMADITRKRNLNPGRRHCSYPRVVKRAGHNSYRVKKKTDAGTRHDRPATIRLANLSPLRLAACSTQWR